MFDYKKVENDIAAAMETILRKWADEHNDIYILSLDCSRDMASIGMIANTKRFLREQSGADLEDYWYYKYCEAEWELMETGGPVKEISSYMKQYVEENDERFTDPETFAFLEAFDEHCDKMIETCQKALKRLKESIKADFPDLLLTFCIGEYLADEERTEFFASVNSEDASKEYAEHIAAFN